MWRRSYAGERVNRDLIRGTLLFLTMTIRFLFQTFTLDVSNCNCTSFLTRNFWSETVNGMYRLGVTHWRNLGNEIFMGSALERKRVTTKTKHVCHCHSPEINKVVSMRCSTYTRPRLLCFIRFRESGGRYLCRSITAAGATPAHTTPITRLIHL